MKLRGESMSFNKDRQQADKPSDETPLVFKNQELTNKEFLNYGVEEMAYIKTMNIAGKKLYAVHAADGEPISLAESRDAAEYAISDNEMDVVTIH